MGREDAFRDRLRGPSAVERGGESGVDPVGDHHEQIAGGQCQLRWTHARHLIAHDASEDERHGLKDTVKAMPGEVVRLAMTFNLPATARVARGEKLRYVFHCHILEHEENEMMRPYDVVG